MAVFSTNQARHLYVATTASTGIIDGDAQVGAISVVENGDDIFFSYKGVAGVTRSDLIKKANILSYSKTSADKMSRKLSRYKVVVDPDIHTTSMIAGQDYILRIAFRNYIGLSESDQYFKYGLVHATSGMDISTFYRDMALSLVKNFSKAESDLLTIYLETEGTSVGTIADTVGVHKDNKKEDLTDTYTGIVIEEKEQEWVLGVMEQVPVNFTLLPTTIIVDGDDRIWGLVSGNLPDDTKSTGNGKQIADLEYFCMGERGDQYRNVGFPHVVRTKYLVDPEEDYDVIDIHYSYIGSGENSQKSEKTITIVGSTSDINTLYTNFTGLL